MYNTSEHLENLIRHIRLVQDASELLGRRLISNGRETFGINLIERGYVHDASKFHGIEWDYLHRGPDVPEEQLRRAIQQHVTTNDHHPEFWGGINNMPEIATAEMVCDWYARAQEFGTSLRDWVAGPAKEKFGINARNRTGKSIKGFVDLLLTHSFQPIPLDAPPAA